MGLSKATHVNNAGSLSIETDAGPTFDAKREELRQKLAIWLYSGKLYTHLNRITRGLPVKFYKKFRLYDDAATVTSH